MSLLGGFYQPVDTFFSIPLYTHPLEIHQGAPVLRLCVSQIGGFPQVRQGILVPLFFERFHSAVKVWPDLRLRLPAGLDRFDLALRAPVPLGSGFLISLQSLVLILFHTAPLLIAQAAVVLSAGKALPGSFQVPLQSLLGILLCSRPAAAAVPQ